MEGPAAVNTGPVEGCRSGWARPTCDRQFPAGPLSEQPFMMTAVLAYLGLVAVTSCACYIAYGLDKRRAANGGWRVPERTLHLLAFLGGWPGAWLGQRQFRHKTNKVPFRILFWVVVVSHLAVVGAVAYAVVGFPPADLGGTPRPISK